MRDFILEKAIPCSIGFVVFSFITMPPEAVRQTVVEMFRQACRYFL